MNYRRTGLDYHGLQRPSVACGDLNCASADGSTVDDPLATVLSEFDLVQHVTKPTRDSRLLDIIAADVLMSIRNVHIVHSAGISDHCLITATYPP